MWEFLYFILGLITGLLVNHWRSSSKEISQLIKNAQRIKNKLPHKMAEIVGLSEEEENFQESLKSELPKKIL